MPPETQQTAAKILEQLKEIIEQELQVVTYKWLARHCAIPAALAKQLLYAFAEAHRGKVAATYFLSGWAKEVIAGGGGDGGEGPKAGSHAGKGGASGSGSGRRHIAQLVDAARLEARKAELAQVTSLHVYSVQPAQPKDTAELWNTDQVQMEALFARLLKGSISGGDATDSGCVPGAALSAVACEAVVRDPARGPRRAAGAKPPPEPAVAAKPKKPGPAEVLEALKTEVEQRGKIQQPSGGVAAKDAGDAAAPAANGIAKPQGNSKQPAASTKPAKPGNKMAGMWSKAPPKRKQPASVPAAAAVHGDANAALRAAQQNEDGGSSSSSGEDIAVAPRGRARGKRVVAALEDDSDDGAEAAQASPSPAQAAEDAPLTANGKSAKKAAGKRPRAPAAKRGSKAAKAADDEDAADGDAPGAGAEGAPEAQPVAKGKAKGKAAKAAPGHVKLGAETGGAVKRRKVMRTYYDDDGDEVTEMVWEDEVPAAEGAPAAGQPSGAAAVPEGDNAAPMETEAGAAEGQELAKTRSGSPAKAASSAKGSGLSGPAGPQKGGGKGPGAGKGSGGAKGGSGGVKKSGKGKAAPPNQRGIMSFFGKPK